MTIASNMFSFCSVMTEGRHRKQDPGFEIEPHTGCRWFGFGRHECNSKGHWLPGRQAESTTFGDFRNSQMWGWMEIHAYICNCVIFTRTRPVLLKLWATYSPFQRYSPIQTMECCLVRLSTPGPWRWHNAAWLRDSNQGWPVVDGRNCTFYQSQGIAVDHWSNQSSGSFGYAISSTQDAQATKVFPGYKRFLVWWP